MKKILSVGIVFSLLIMAFLTDARAQQQRGSVPPMAQSLVREGDFAVSLAETLNVGNVQSEAEAESTLTSVGIAPRNGWIANYPVTPDIIGELRNAVGEAAESGRLPMKRVEAESTLDTLSANLGLSVVPGTGPEVAQNQPPAYGGQPSSSEPAPSYGEYSNPEVVNNYYYNEGPPVVTYYPPPWDYYYLYAWVPYPFWCTGFFFPGYFILNDFSRPIFFGDTVVVVSNHHHDHHSGRIHRIDPVTRHSWKDLGGNQDSSRWGRGNSADAREGASSIYRRTLERRSSLQPPPEGRNRGGGGRDSGYPRPGERYDRGRPPRTGGNPPALNERREVPGRPSSGDRSQRRTWPDAGTRERGGTSYYPPASSNRSFSAPPQGDGRSYRSPSTGTNLSGGMGRNSGGSSSSGGRGSLEGSHGGGGRPGQ